MKKDTELARYIDNYINGALDVIQKLSQDEIVKAINMLVKVRANNGRLFLLGVGGSAANCSHAVNDFRKIAHIETYAPTDNVSELTARTNDESFDSIFIEWLKISKLSKKDAVMVFSVGGGSVDKNISVNIVKALQYSKKIGANILGVVSRDGGYTRKVADVCILVPVVDEEKITPFAESIQALVWHAMVFSPTLRKA